MARNSGGITLGSLKFVLGMDALAFEQGADAAQKRMKQVQREFENTGKKLSGIGQTLSLGLTAPLAAFAAKGVNEARETAAAMGQVQAALQSMGPVAGRTSEQLAAMADNLEKTSTFEGDQILSKVTANLLTFGNVQGEVFDRAQQAVADYSARTGTDLQSATIMLGKALNDPVNGMGALTKTGTLSKEWIAANKGVIESLVNTGQTAKAQGMILDEFARQYSGAAQEAQNADPWNAMSDSINSMAESVGNILLPMMKPLADALQSVADAFTGLSPETQKWIAYIGIGAATIGPLLIGLGALASAVGALIPVFTALGPVISGVRLAMTLLAANPVVLAFAGVIAGIYLAWQNWDKIKPIIDRVGAAVTGWWNGNVKPVLDAVGGAVSGVINWFSQMGTRIGAAVSSAYTAVKTWIGDRMAAVWETAKGFVNGYIAFVQRMPSRMIEIGRNIIDGLVRGIRAAPGAVAAALGDIVSGAIRSAKQMLGIRSPSRVFMQIGDYIGQGLAVGMEGTRGRVAAAAKGMTEAARKAAQETATLLRRLYPELEQAEKYAADRKLISESGLSQGDKDRAALRLAAERDGFDRTARVEIKALEQGPIVNSEEITRQLGIFQRSLARAADGSEVQTVRIAKSFKDMTDEVIGSLRGLIDGIKKGDILSIVQGIAGVFQTLAGAGVFGKTVQGRVQNFKGFRAMGGPVEAGGTYMVGERGPEFFTPKSSGFIHPNGSMPAAGALTLGISPSPLFHVYARDQAGRVVAESSPGIARSTASGIQSNWQAEGLRTLPG